MSCFCLQGPALGKTLLGHREPCLHRRRGLLRSGWVIARVGRASPVCSLWGGERTRGHGPTPRLRQLHRQQTEPTVPPPPSSQTCVIRAWDRSKPLLFCPAMNTAMWEHPLTEQQVCQLKAFGYVEIPCVAKKLVCGDQGGCLARLTAHSYGLGLGQGSASDPSLL